MDGIGGVSNTQRTKDNLDQLQRGLFVPEGTYKYAPIGPNEIRLLHLLPADNKGDMITSQLKVASLDDESLHYEALSYTWGTDEPTEKMWIQGGEQHLSQPSDQLPTSRPANPAKRMLQDRAREEMEKERRAPKTFYVRPNLSDALRHLRDYADESPNESRKEPQTTILWIDAICINQKDQDEKSLQVATMAKIYQHADGVFVWLGKEGDESNMGMEFVERIPKLEQQGMLSVKGSSAQQWSAFVSLMKREWFSRRWVVQELALADTVYLACGDRFVNWEQFVVAVEFFIASFDTITALYNEKSADFKQKLLSLGDVQASGAGKMISVTNEYVRSSRERLKSLEALVSELTMFEVGDPRDTIYALMALAGDIPNGSARPSRIWRSEAASRATFEADYSKNILQVYKDFIAFCVIGSESLDILCRKWAPHRRLKRLNVTERVKFRGRRPPTEEIFLPSWVGLLKESAFGVPRAGPQTRVAGNSLVDTPNKKCYDASGGRPADILFGEIKAAKKEGWLSEAFLSQYPHKLTPSIDIDLLDLRSKDLLSNPSAFKVTANETLEKDRGRKSDGTLYVRGFRIGPISKISHRLFEGLIPQEWLTLGGWSETPEGAEASDIPEVLWRTLVANRTPDGKEPPRWYAVALSWAIDHRNANGDIHTAELIRQGQPQRMVDLLKRVQEVIWDRRFFLLSGNIDDRMNRFGIAPSRAKKDDVVCVLLGCSAPVVLSPINKSDPRCGYKLVGEAYIHDFMNGEILPLPQYPCSTAEYIKEKSEEFCLV